MATREERVAAAVAAAAVAAATTRGAAAHEELSGLRREVAELAAIEDSTRFTLRQLQRMRSDLDQALAGGGGERDQWRGWSAPAARALHTWTPAASVVPGAATAPPTPPPSPPPPPLSPPPTPGPDRMLREALGLDAAASGAGLGAVSAAAAAASGSPDAAATAASLLFCSLVVLREVRAEVRRLRLRMRTRRRAGSTIAGGASAGSEAEGDAMDEDPAQAQARARAAGAEERTSASGDAPPAELDTALRGLQPQDQVTVLRAERLRLLREIAAARAEAEVRRRLLRGVAAGGEALSSSLGNSDGNDAYDEAATAPSCCDAVGRGVAQDGSTTAPLAALHANAFGRCDPTTADSYAERRYDPLSAFVAGERSTRTYPSDMEYETEEEIGSLRGMSPSSPAGAAGVALGDGVDECEDGALPDVTGPAEDEEDGEAVREDVHHRQDEEKEEGELNAELRTIAPTVFTLARPNDPQQRRPNDHRTMVDGSGETTVSLQADGEENEDTMGALPDLA